MKNDIDSPQKINHFEWLLIFALAAFIMCLSACNTNRVMTGKVTSIKGKSVTIDSLRTFTVFDTTGLYIGKYVSFIGTVVRSKINSRRAN